MKRFKINKGVLMNNPANPADMEEILSSIRNTLEEETGKVGKEDGQKPEGEAPAAADTAGKKEEAAEAGGEDDVLDLSESQMVEEETEAEQAAPDAAGQDTAAVPAEGNSEEMIDIDAFAKAGKTRTLSSEEVEKVKGEDPTGEGDVVETVDVAEAEAAAEAVAEQPAAVAEASHDFDRLLAELKEEDGAEPGAEAPAGPPEVNASPEEAKEVAEASSASAPPLAEETQPQAEQPAPAVEVPLAPAAARMQLPVIPASTGLQVALPAEILAEALRPLIKDWVAENLPNVVERLVAEEIAKLVKD